MMDVSTHTPICGRPAGEVRQALLQACEQLHKPGQSATLQELAQAACVGLDVARRTLDNLRRARLVAIVRHRRVSYRNRPVAEWAPGAAWAGGVGHGAGSSALATVLQSWGR
ncbi:hypothetical protein [Comamonas odontotermitis]|uniref:hypothetical protein n=1 Tax=Comamonas odontotermitis TaxID=379895 RepID=UPI001CC35D6E|nr:hypothetical protein [Comamonas odontotermitis]UBB19515.1 hypothetical protein LAD35_22180 [Comamonas odontotermitis]